MKSKTTLLIVLFLISATLFSRLDLVCSVSQTTITFDPTQSFPSAGESVPVNAVVLNVTNLSGWQLLIGFNPSIINCSGVTVPPDNIFDGDYLLFPPEISNTEGYVKVFCVLDGAYSVNGSGNLCRMDFQCLTPGVTALGIIRLSCVYCSTYLQEPDNDLISFVSVEGAVEVTEQGFLESWFNLETQPILIFSNSTITAFDCDETLKEITFDATGTTGTNGLTTVVTPKSIINGTKIMALIGETPVLPSLSKNSTHNFIHFTYQHSTKHVKVLITLLGDVNGDRKVRVDDILAVVFAFGLDEGDPGWNPLYDLNGDDRVRVDDVLFVAGDFGKEW